MKSLAKILDGEIEIHKDSTDVSTLIAVIDGNVETIQYFDEEWKIDIDNPKVGVGK